LPSVPLQGLRHDGLRLQVSHSGEDDLPQLPDEQPSQRFIGAPPVPRHQPRRHRVLPAHQPASRALHPLAGRRGGDGRSHRHRPQEGGEGLRRRLRPVLHPVGHQLPCIRHLLPRPPRAGQVLHPPPPAGVHRTALREDIQVPVLHDRATLPALPLLLRVSEGGLRPARGADRHPADQHISPGHQGDVLGVLRLGVRPSHLQPALRAGAGKLAQQPERQQRVLRSHPAAHHPPGERAGQPPLLPGGGRAAHPLPTQARQPHRHGPLQQGGGGAGTPGDHPAATAARQGDGRHHHLHHGLGALRRRALQGDARLAGAYVRQDQAGQPRGEHRPQPYRREHKRTHGHAHPRLQDRQPEHRRDGGGGGTGADRGLWQVRHQHVPLPHQRGYGCGEGGAVTVPRPAEVPLVRDLGGEGEVPDGPPAGGV
jgi:hypothetical protein